jgi:DNA-binding NarL/FixJ family response regulator
MRILIVDDHEVVREGLAAALDRDPRLEIVGLAATGSDALALARQQLPDLVVLDLRLPDMPGDEVTRTLRKRFPHTAVLVLTSYLSEDTVRCALEAGAASYVTKTAGLSKLRSEIERISEGEDLERAYAADQIVSELETLAAARCKETNPTRQQKKVLELASHGYTNVKIAEELLITESTVRFHFQNLKIKYSARTRAELVAKAIRLGVVESPHGDAVTSASR